MRSLVTFTLLFCCHYCYSQERSFNYFPKADMQYQVINYNNYSLAYSEEYEQAAWVAYELTKAEVETKVVSRTNDYREDSNCPTGSATLEDYKYSGFDRGHLAPAADFVFCPKAMSECFFMTNMSPQRPSFNRDIWLKLKVQTRSWASENKQLYVLVGGVLEDQLQKNRRQ